MIYAYIRVSTEMQNYSSQEFEIDNYCRLHNLKIDKWYSEAISGTKPIEKRILGRIIRKMNRGDLLICTEISRLGRNMLDGRDHIWRPGATDYNGAPESVKPFSYAKNSLRNFYDTGFETNNTITVKGGSQSTGFVVSYGNVYSNGILPGNLDYYKRNTFSARGNTKIKEGRAWLNYGLNYIRKDMRNAMGGQGGNGSTIYNDILQYPVDIDYADLRDYSRIIFRTVL